ncbi:lyso-ornithine lipid acyltransferase [Rhodovulum sp. ES.010]|uniref:lysophospholipid acyltransferase family protein n=1 Tax=Rhodovulum sp. ES.010 TaxID=1882821 RepID=UPI00092B8603|nr:lysophospholipid acyltransferase family protein [Rhodovulum sp. ES.010]SIO21311.1 lyso-ornithine lipid acyltransferase [Rhodovulum sp. ES.010]
MTPWNGAEPPPVPPMTAAAWARALLRGGALAVVTFGCLGLLLLVRLIERPLFGWHRPVTPFITQFVCRMAFVILGMRYTVRGQLMRARGAVVANHASWLDIFALNARKRVYFVSKAEVAGWPGIGWLARATGTVFINRDRREAKAHNDLFEERLKANHKLLFFPEGTSTDGCRVLPFKTTLFAAFFTEELRDILHVQPVTVIYSAPPGEHPGFYGWWAEMGFGAHLLKVLAARAQGGVTLVYQAPLRVADFPDRKALAKACEEAVRTGMADVSAET